MGFEWGRATLKKIRDKKGVIMEYFHKGKRDGYGITGYTGKEINDWIVGLKKKSFYDAHRIVRDLDGLGKQDRYYIGRPNTLYLIAIKEFKNGKAGFEIALMDSLTYLNYGVSDKLKWYKL